MFLQLFLYFVLSIFILTIVLCLCIVVLRTHYSSKKNKFPSQFSVAFFHPYCNSGGGGERVLWCAVSAVSAAYPKVKIIIYTGDLDASPIEIVKQAKLRFNIILPSNLEFIYLHKRKWVEAENYPYFTLLGQSIGSIILGIEALKLFQPDVYIDTMGYAFTFPLFYIIAKCKVGCYVHYPTISSDMMNKVVQQRGKRKRISYIKLFYYQIFAKLYSMVGWFSDSIIVNSSWTEDHIKSLWKRSLSTHKVYPPCDTSDLQCIPLERSNKKSIKIISLAQFRPEKDHPLQLKAMYHLRQLVTEHLWENIELVFIGSTRNQEDKMRVVDMMDLCKHLSLENNVKFKVNVSYEELKQELSEGFIGLHSMWNEHFGIGIVECMAAGLIMVAHRSGGPLMDIIIEEGAGQNGFLATNEVEYAHAIHKAILLTDEQKLSLQKAARGSVNRFSNDQFRDNFLRAVQPLFSSKKLT
ncbi:GDP-Man:Man(3)GlcNAc(2)-PP-Dol alpha-1,2-mannosyltransferase [Daktulosphaira vitifoliae]|uniref:GDP-Man:Man(3)GlcNAc(2)-PP-Dol alpha-1,2-mannosyltransferase n=1 Tax=Daktulosphaira vitifoliae TaxID=58002 RepID=UPI0021A98F00|nr:GDP-Man:Man(3)GlcNAc(2)-PP-Dol alpha-1,2-mannosyltransferase [Daktulosphaira vitifoliae]